LQGLENWSSPQNVLTRFAEAGVSTDFAYWPFREVTFYDSRLRPAVARSEEPLFYLVRRGSDADTFDTALLKQARAAGAEITFRETVTHANAGSILATGPRHSDGIVAGYTFRTRLPDQAHTIVSPRLAPGGYAYLLICAGHATIATSLFTDQHAWRQARTATVDAFQHLVPQLRLTDVRAFGGYGNVLGPARYTDAAGRLYVGEAAGLQDAEWGFGMGFAVASGALAAASILDGGDYAQRARQRFDSVLRAGLANRALFEALPPRIVDPLLRWEASRPELRRRMTAHWAPHQLKTLAAPLSRLALADRTHAQVDNCADASCTCVRCRPNSERRVTAGSLDRA
jgi:flavin-dependent dehydrogenase